MGRTRLKYRCPDCNNKIPVDDLEAVYREQLREFLLSPEEIDAHAAAAKDAMREKQTLIETIEAELKKLETEDDRLYQLYMADGLSKDDFARRHKPLSARRNQLEEELPRLQAELDVLRIGSVSREETLSEAQGLAERWSDLAVEEKRQIVESITERIVVGKEEVEIHLLQVSPVGIGADKGNATFTDSAPPPAAPCNWPGSGCGEQLARATITSPVSFSGWRSEIQRLRGELRYYGANATSRRSFSHPHLGRGDD